MSPTLSTPRHAMLATHIWRDNRPKWFRRSPFTPRHIATRNPAYTAAHMTLLLSVSAPSVLCLARVQRCTDASSSTPRALHSPQARFRMHLNDR